MSSHTTSSSSSSSFSSTSTAAPVTETVSLVVLNNTSARTSVASITTTPAVFNQTNADICNSALVSWSSKYSTNFSTTITSTETFTTSTFSLAPAGNSTVYTLCDQWPREDRVGTFSYYLTSSLNTYTSHVPTVVPTPAESQPCVLNSAQCSSLCGLATGTPACACPTQTLCDADIDPQCAISKTVCAIESLYTEPVSVGEFAPCTFRPQTIRLIYFPETRYPDYLCGNYTTHGSAYGGNATTPVTVESLGYTFTSGTAYISYSRLYALDRCGQYTGTPLSNYILPVPSSAVSILNGVDGIQNFATLPLTFADLNYPVPISVYSRNPRCDFGNNNDWQKSCPTAYDGMSVRPRA